MKHADPPFIVKVAIVLHEHLVYSENVIPHHVGIGGQLILSHKLIYQVLSLVKPIRQIFHPFSVAIDVVLAFFDPVASFAIRSDEKWNGINIEAPHHLDRLVEVTMAVNVGKSDSTIHVLSQEPVELQSVIAMVELVSAIGCYH